MEYNDLILNHPSLFDNINAPLKIVLDPNKITDWKNRKTKEIKAEGNFLESGIIGVIYEDKFILALRDLVEFPNGETNGYFRIINNADIYGGQSVVILCEMNKKYLLLHQYRHPIRKWSYEAPRGFGEPGKKANEQAKNEILEETGGIIKDLIDLGDYYINSGIEGSIARLFFASISSEKEPNINEGIDRFIWVSLGKFEDMLRNLEILDGFTIAAYTRAKLNGLLTE
jgi:8-oxo-dGTP pyrophosphatase MutT (NUDIX family)